MLIRSIIRSTPARALIVACFGILTSCKPADLGSFFQSGDSSGSSSSSGGSVTITSLTPTSGPLSGGNTLLISGSGFEQGAQVTLGGSVCIGPLVSASAIQCTVPSHQMGAASVAVTNPDGTNGTLASAYTFLAIPTIASISPSSGPLGGGTNVTVSGMNFAQGTTVEIGGSSCNSVTVSSTTTIQCVTSSHSAGSVAVAVTVPSNPVATLSNGFIYNAPPSVSSFTPASGSLSGGGILAITGSNFLSGATVTIGSTTCGSPLVSSTQIDCLIPTGTAGPNSVTVTNPDGQNAMASTSYIYLAPPSVSAITPTSGSMLGGTSVIITGSGFQTNATVAIGGATCVSPSIASNQILCTTSSHIAGAASVIVSNPDGQNGSLNNGYTYVAGPTVTSVSPSLGAAAGNTAITISGSNFQSGAQVSIGGTSCSVTATSSSSISCTTAAHSAGQVSITVTNADLQAGTLSNGYTYIAPPILSSVSPSGGALTGTTLITVSGSGFTSGLAATLGSSCGSVNILSGTQFTCTTTTHSAAVVSLSVTDSYGQVVSLPNVYTYEAAPTVTSISPSTGAVGGGTSVTIAGTGFIDPTVSIGGSNCGALLSSATQITCTTTGHSAQMVNVVVTNSDNQFGTESNAFSYQGGPTISSVSPVGGALGGGTTLTITGTGFASGATVALGSANCNVSSTSSTQIVCATSSSSAGAVNVKVTNPDSQTAALNGGYTYEAAPNVTAVSPSAGPLAGGNIVTLTGTGFLPSAQVYVGGTSCGSVLTSATSINCVVPSHATGSVNIQVTNTDGQTTTVNSAYTYNPAPVVSSISPTGGALAGGTTVTVTGTGFLSGATLAFGSTNCSNPLVSSTQIVCATPAHALGSVNVTVTNTDAQSSLLTNGFTYEAAPTVTSISPSAGGLSGGTLVTITGTGFLSSATVSLGTATCSTVSVVSSTQLTCTPSASTAGTVTATVTNFDGQVGSLSSAYSYVGAYTLTSISPTAGALGGATAVTITGNGFTSGASVTIGNAACSPVNVANSTSLSCTTSTHAAGAVDVVVKDIYNQSTTLSSAYTYQAAPSVSAISPTAGALGGGTSVTITGSYFLSGALVSIGGSVCSSPLVSSGSISCTTTAHSAQVSSVVVTNADNQLGTGTNLYTYQAAPTVSSISPTGGSTSGNVAVTITGTGFLTGATVAIGTSSCSVTSVSSTQINCTTASFGAGTYNVAVTNTDAQVGTLTNGFTYRVAPAVTSVSPTTGFLYGGYTLTISGTGFVSGSVSATVGGQACTGVTVVSSTQVTCTVPSTTSAGAVGVAFTNPDGQVGTLSNAFTYKTNAFSQLSVVTGSIDSRGPIDGTGSGARFSFGSTAVGVATDGTYLYVADNSNYVIRKITIGTWVTSVLAGTTGAQGFADGTNNGRLWSPWALTIDPTKTYLYLADGHAIRQITISSGLITTIAGNVNTPGYVNSPGTAARFNTPWGISTDGTNVYVGDSNNQVIRQVVISSGAVSTLAGTSGTSGSTNGTGAGALFNSPRGVALDSTYQNLYIADYSNCSIRKLVISTQAVTTAFGTSGTCNSVDGVGGYINRPVTLTFDASGNLYFAQTGGAAAPGTALVNNIRAISQSTGAISTIAGSSSGSGCIDGTGTNALFNYPAGLATDGNYVYVLDSGNSNIREVKISTGAVTTVVGVYNYWGIEDGTASQTRFWDLQGLTLLNNTIYSTDTNNMAIRATSLSTLATTTLAGSSYSFNSEMDGFGEQARFYYPFGITNDGTYLYVTDYTGDTIRKIDPSSGQVTTIAGAIVTSGTTDGAGNLARFNSPEGITSDGTNLYVADTNNHTIRKIVISTGVVSTIAGTAGTSGAANGTGTAALFNLPKGITTDLTNLYVAEQGNCDIRVINISSLAVTSLAGAAGNCTFQDGSGTNAHLNAPSGITYDGTYLYVADLGNHAIRQVSLAGVVTTIVGAPAAAYDTTNGGSVPGSTYIRNPIGILWTNQGLFIANYYGLDVLR